MHTYVYIQMIRNKAVMSGFPHNMNLLDQAMTNKAGIVPKFSLAPPATKDGSGFPGSTGLIGLMSDDR